jgi:hypothetical protein
VAAKTAEERHVEVQQCSSYTSESRLCTQTHACSCKCLCTPDPYNKSCLPIISTNQACKYAHGVIHVAASTTSTPMLNDVPMVFVVLCVLFCLTALLSPRSASLATMPHSAAALLATSTLREFYITLQNSSSSSSSSSRV